MLKKHLESKLKETYSTQKIKKYAKKEMKYTYKKGCWRPPIYSTRRTQLVKALFWVELISFIAKGEVIINWDVSSFDRSMKKEYSRLPVRKSSQIINDRLKRRATLILATWNTWEWTAMVVLDTVNKEKFWFFWSYWRKS